MHILYIRKLMKHLYNISGMIRTLIILMFIATITGCSPHYKQVRKAEKRKKQLEVTKQQRYKETEEQYLAAVERHKKLQTKATRKQMKKLQRRSDEFAGTKRTPFYRRWFTRKPATTRPRDRGGS